MLFDDGESSKKGRKNAFYHGTQLNFFASILGCQLKKHLVNPLQNGITIWR